MCNVQELWEQKKMSMPELAAQVQPGWVCCSDIALGTPYTLLNAVAKQLRERGGQGTLHTILDVAPLLCYDKEYAPYFHGISWFSGAGARAAARAGYGDLMPCYYRDMPELFSGLDEIDAFFCCVAPMDRHGYFSVGINGSNSPAMLRKAKRVYLQVNNQMPRALSAPQIHITQVTAFCEHNEPLPQAGKAVLDDTSKAIGSLIADEIPDGATIQLGIGAIPDAVGHALLGKHDLGIHTELLTDSMIDLIEAGVVTNQRKPLYTGRTVAVLSYGSQRMYDYINDNPSVEFLPVDYVNDPAVIAAHPDFMSINGAVEVDFYGQVCAESVGTKHISGTGGQVDYVRGSVQSKGGKSFIAFSSTTQNGTVSRIRPTLTPGAIVTTSKNDVDHIVTEYGVAKLRGKTLSQRTKALIAIAHPKFRNELLYEARKMNILI